MKKKILLMLLTILLSVEMVFHPYQAKAITWVETTIDYERVQEVRTTGVVYFDRSCVSSKTDWWKAYRIEKGTLIGKIVMTVSSGRASTATPKTSKNSVSYGTTWPQSYDIYITMQPKNYIQCKYYCGYTYNMNQAKVDASLVTTKFYVASDYLKNYCTVAKGTSGFISNWSPRIRNTIDGADKFEVTAGLNMTTDGTGAGVTVAKTIEITDDFVNTSDYTNINNGRYQMNYDYKITDTLGNCSSARKKVIFADTTVHDSVFWYNKSKTMNGKVYAYGTFTICDNKYSPICYESFSKLLTSDSMTIK